MKFLLVRGRHARKLNGVNVVYNPGDVIETEVELDTLFNQPPMSVKFNRLEEDDKRFDKHLKSTSKSTEEPQKENDPVEPQFEKMTLKKLKEFAEENEIDCDDCTTKDEYVTALKEAYDLA